MRKYCLVVIFLLTTTLSFSSGQAHSDAQAPAATGARASDVSSMDNILAALYDVISGPAGQKRDWNRCENLFWQGARLVAIEKTRRDTFEPQTMTLDEYMVDASKYFSEHGVYEKEIARHVDHYGHIYQVFSTYESRHSPEEKPFERGINSIQLAFDGQRWWVISIYWEGESTQTPIPAEWLPKQ